MIPTGQSLVADYYGAAQRGRAFGGLQMTGALGGMLGSLYATNLGTRRLRLVQLSHRYTLHDVPHLVSCPEGHAAHALWLGHVEIGNCLQIVVSRTGTIECR